MRAWIVAAVLLVGCMSAPSLETTYWQARSSFVQSEAGYNHFLDYDNRRVQACYVRHEGESLAPAALKEACPPTISREARERALEIVQQAELEFTSAEPLLNDPSGSQTVAEALGRIESLTLQLLATYGGAR